MPILLWVLVKTKLWERFNCRIIATGFDIEQQNGIVNTEPKKIIHTLEDEQRSVHNLSKMQFLHLI
jgi:cell division protein FtsZ